MRLKEIEDQRKGITNSHGYYGYSNSSRKKDPNAMDVDQLSTEEMECHRKERLCFCCHKTGHIGQNCKNTRTNQKQAKSKPQDNKKKYRNNMIRKILMALDEEEEEEEQAPKKEDKEEGKEGKDKQDFQ